MNSNAKILPWQEQNWQQLFAYILQQRLPQALLLTGIKGVGKAHLAKQFAQSLLCQKQDRQGFFCDSCGSCTLFKAATHPDFISIQPDEAGKNISIGQIRELNASLMLKPQFETSRVVLIDPAEQMSQSAVNAFLKTLEEPTARTIIILLSTKPYLLPATIMSRCQKLNVKTPDLQIGSEWLQQNITYITNVSALLAVANGAPLLARDFAIENYHEIRLDCFNSWINIASKQASPLQIAEKWQTLETVQILNWMTSWVIDIIKYNYDQETNSLINSDLQASLKQLAFRLDLRGVFEFYDLLLVSNTRQTTQINKLLMFEDILIR